MDVLRVVAFPDIAGNGQLRSCLKPERNASAVVPAISSSPGAGCRCPSAMITEVEELPKPWRLGLVTIIGEYHKSSCWYFICQDKPS